MKVLIITYYWPPSGGSGVQRWLKFVKYLRDFGIEPIVYTVENPEYAIEDFSLENEIPEGVTVLRKPIFEPNTFFSFFSKKSKSQSSGFLNPNPGLAGKILQYIRANYFIPDARKYWITPSVKYLEKYLKKHQIETIISTGPPHSMHLIAMKLKERLGVTWISDFRDPWTEIDYFHQLPLTDKSKRKHYELEKRVVSKSNAIIVVGNTMKKNFEKEASNIHVITNGFDSENSQKIETLDTTFSLTHIGMMNADRNPKKLWKVLRELCDEDIEFKNDLRIQLIGKIAPEVQEQITAFDANTIFTLDYISHDEAKLYQQKSQVLLLAINNVPSAKGIITGKIFEYLQANRPILAIGPEDGDAAEIINDTKAGIMVGFEDKQKLKKTILDFYTKFKQHNLTTEKMNIQKYHRKKLTEELSLIIKSTIVK
ncbi:MAG: glycosyltransferase family 4 protein [Flavobacteriaceae bacterium]